MRRIRVVVAALALAVLSVPGEATSAQPLVEYKCVAQGSFDGHKEKLDGSFVWFWRIHARGTCLRWGLVGYDIKVDGPGFAFGNPPFTTGPRTPFNSYLTKVTLTNRQTGRVKSSVQLLTFVLHQSYFGSGVVLNPNAFIFTMQPQLTGGGAGMAFGRIEGLGAGLWSLFTVESGTSSAPAAFVITMGAEPPEEVPI